jgi:Ca2+-binding RTX toxin-like protein
MADGAIGTATADNFGINEALGQTIELSDGRLAGFFGRFSTATDYQISARFFTAEGVPIGSATPLDFVIDRALGRAIVMAALPTSDGGFVVLHNGDDGLPEPLRNETHLYLARYDSDGSLDERVRVTDTAALWDIRSFEIAPDGDFVAAITPNSTDLQLVRLVAADPGELVLTGGADSDRQPLGSLDDWYDGGDGGDTAFGRAGDDRLYGRAGNDLLYGDLGNDLLDGGDGADTLVGGAGNDTFRGGAGNDVIQAGAGGDNRVDLSGGGNNRVLLGSGADTVIGGTGDDVILGGRGGNNRIDLSAGGNNRVNAGDGADTIIGGAGRDVIRPGRGDDLVDLRAGGDNFVFNLRGNSTILGGAGDDVIVGGIGDTLILAGGGNNRIVAGPGRDTIGFVQEAHETRLLDFRPGSDVMDFTGHDGVSGLGDLAIAQLGSNLVITDGSGGRIVLAGVTLDQIDDSAFLF